MATLSQLIDKLDRFQPKVERIVVRDLREEAPVANTGYLKSSIRVLSREKFHYSNIGSRAPYADDVSAGGPRFGLFPDYHGNRKSVHKPTESDFATPIFNPRTGSRKFQAIRYARANPFDLRAMEGLEKVDWNEVFWDESGEYATIK